MGLSASSTEQSSSVWQSICVRILPMFNGEGLKGCIEDLNELVNRFVKETPQQKILFDLSELLLAGMLTLTTKLYHSSNTTTNSLNESMIIAARLSVQWSFFYGKVLPYLQGAFLPIRISLKAKGFDSDLFEIRNICLSSFRENVVLPVSGMLEDSFPKLPPMNGSSSTDVSSLLRQMLLILNSVPFNNASTDTQRATAQLMKLLITPKKIPTQKMR